jgi:thiosulfate dehydrogenase (quinone) large subunit
MQSEPLASHSEVFHQDPARVSRILSSTRLAPIWLLPRVYVGWIWMSIGWTLLQSPAWMHGGSAMHEAWQPGRSSVAWAEGQTGAGLNPIPYLIESGLLGWTARITAIGITVAGIAVLLGIATGFAAFTGVVLSVNIIATGSVAPGPEVIGLAILLVLAWKTAGWIGLDRWALPLAGAPWQGGFAMQRRNVTVRTERQGGADPI